MTPQPYDDYAACAVVREAEDLVTFESFALEALGLFSVEQLRAVTWVGLLDDGWSRLLAELRRRGERL